MQDILSAWIGCHSGAKVYASPAYNGSVAGATSASVRIQGVHRGIAEVPNGQIGATRALTRSPQAPR
jgi:hypothetical protein